MNLPLTDLTPYEHYDLYGYYPAVIAHAPSEPVTTPRISCLDSPECRVRLGLRRLEQKRGANVEGVYVVRRFDRYFIDGRKYTFEGAVARLMGEANG